ncbi:MAG: choice-of-anchor D domain-containing protein, partial [Candidatus Syntrophosphaera sp.]|nr:choice-of-anchor D domain-containing protein [Candidatus Syntrophosphaera sp.]
GFYMTATTGPRSRYIYNDTAPYDALTVTGGTGYANIPNVMLGKGAPPEGPPNAPILTYPANGQIELPVEGFNLQWSPDYSGGAGVPDYYAVYMSMDELTIYDDYYWEIPSAHFNPVTEGGIAFSYDQRWYWTVEAVNAWGSGLVDPPQWFEIISPPAQISVAPTSLTETLAFGNTSVQQLTISNTGGMPLNFSIGLQETPPVRSLITPVDLSTFQAPSHSRNLESERSPFIGPMTEETNRAIFDVQFIYPVSGLAVGAHYGIVTDGDFFYSGNWQGTAGSQTIHKYNLDGTFVEDFNIDGGAMGIRGLTWDGEYFYGSANSTTIYKMDFAAGTTVGTITAPVAVRGIAYDSDNDAFWITTGWGGPLSLLARDGTVLQTLTTAASSMGDIVFDNISGPNPTLWANTQNGSFGNMLQQISLTDGSLVQTFDVTPDQIPGLTIDNIAGGITIATNLVPGKASLVPMVQNLLFYGLELCQTANWALPTPATGTVPAGQSVVVDVTFDAVNNPPGYYEGDLVITHSAPTATVYVPIDLTVTGDWDPVFAINPTAWEFGDLEIMNPSVKEFTITNLGAPTLTINAGDIYLSGDTEGNFTLNADGLPVALGNNGTYSFTVTFAPLTVGAKTATLNIQDNLTARVLHTVPLSGTGLVEPIGEIVNLNATVVNNEDVLLTWGLSYGGGGTPGWIHYDDGINYDSIGTGGVANFDVAIKFDSGTMYGYNGMEITHIKFWPASSHTNYTLKVWTGGDAGLIPTTMVYSQAVTVIPDQWNDFTLTTPVPITGTDAVWIGYNCDVLLDDVIGEYWPAGCDAGPALVNYGDLIQLGGTWYSMYTQWALNFNWNLQAYVDDPGILASRSRLLSIPVVSTQPSDEFLRRNMLSTANDNPPQNRVLRGYNVYRDMVQINSSLVPTNSYTDYGLTPGTYSYTVQAIYYSANSAMSDPAIAVITPPVPIALPFLEDWVSGDYTTNQWTAGSTNWFVTPGTGNPAPSLTFGWSPTVTDYDIPFTSHWFDGNVPDRIDLTFDIMLDNYGLALNAMTWEVYDGTTWHFLGTVDNSAGDIPWTTYTYDITSYVAGGNFKLRFRATGANSYDINYWYIDNIALTLTPLALDAPDVAIALVGGVPTLSWLAVDNATTYNVYGSADPFAADPWTLLDTTANLTYTYTGVEALRFFKVTANN